MEKYYYLKGSILLCMQFYIEQHFIKLKLIIKQGFRPALAKDN